MKAAVGVEPCNASEYDDAIDEAIRNAARTGKAHAIGPCGLTQNDAEAQERAFRCQVNIALEFEMPLIVLANGAHERVRSLLEQESFSPHRTLVHAFEGSDEELAQWVQTGCFVSFSGKSANDPDTLLRQAKLVPANRLLIESGAPDEALRILSGFPARCDQSVFVAEIVLPHVSAEQIAANTAAFYEQHQLTEKPATRKVEDFCN